MQSTASLSCCVFPYLADAGWHPDCGGCGPSDMVASLLLKTITRNNNNTQQQCTATTM